MDELLVVLLARLEDMLEQVLEVLARRLPDMAIGLSDDIELVIEEVGSGLVALGSLLVGAATIFWYLFCFFRFSKYPHNMLLPCSPPKDPLCLFFCCNSFSFCFSCSFSCRSCSRSFSSASRFSSSSRMRSCLARSTS